MTHVNYDCPEKFVPYINGCLDVLGLWKFPDLELTVVMEPTITGGAHGYCWGDTEEVEVEIATDKVAMDELCLTIAHELIHAKQYASGVLDDMNWKGKCYRDTKYTELPWEEEAFKKEEEVMMKAIEIVRRKI